MSDNRTSNSSIQNRSLKKGIKQQEPAKLQINKTLSFRLDLSELSNDVSSVLAKHHSSKAALSTACNSSRASSNTSSRLDKDVSNQRLIFDVSLNGHSDQTKIAELKAVILGFVFKNNLQLARGLLRLVAIDKPKEARQELNGKPQAFYTKAQALNKAACLLVLEANSKVLHDDSSTSSLVQGDLLKILLAQQPMPGQLPQQNPSQQALQNQKGQRSASNLNLSIVAGKNAGNQTEIPAGKYKVEIQNSLGDFAGNALLHPKHLPALSSTQSCSSALFLEAPIAEAKTWFEGVEANELAATHSAVLSLGSKTKDETLRSDLAERPLRELAPPIRVAKPELQVPDPPKPAQKFAWITLLIPIPIVVVLAVFLRPTYALFAMMAPLFAVGRWAESKHRFRRESKTYIRQKRVAENTYQHQMAEHVKSCVQRAWQANPHLAELGRRATTGSVKLWERRPQSEGFLSAFLGVDENGLPEIVDLESHGGIAIAGKRSRSLPIAQSLLSDLCINHGPADIEILLASDANSVKDWEWIKWLPHRVRGVEEFLDTAVLSKTRAKRSQARTNNSSAFQNIQTQNSGNQNSRLAKNNGVGIKGVPKETERCTVLICDSKRFGTANLDAVIQRCETQLKVIAISERMSDLPANCDYQIETNSTTSPYAVIQKQVDSSAFEAASQPEGQSDNHTFKKKVVVSLPAASSVDTWARAMSFRVDPLAKTATNGNSGLKLSEVLEIQRHIDSPKDLSREVKVRWQANREKSSLVATVGSVTIAGESVPFELDFCHDGPHMMIAGTTGSGKSELLRSLVVSLAVKYSPEQLNFLLIDFKGGGAFDSCEALPQVIGVITDLDLVSTSRALGALNAEITRRETTLRDMGYSDINQAHAERFPLARLVIVVDEFAALANSYPEKLAELCDLAARGRSLGMHLVMATQRPAGVINAKIQANINARIALRVASQNDSMEVIGTAQAASLSRNSPGAAIAAIGSEPHVGFQSAYSGYPADEGQEMRLSSFTLGNRCASIVQPKPAQKAKPKSLNPTKRTSHRPNPLSKSQTPNRASGKHPARTSKVTTELEALVNAVKLCAETHPPAAALWAPPLPESLKWSDLHALYRESTQRDLHKKTKVSSCGPNGVLIGLLDDVESVERQFYSWQPKSGPLFIVSNPSCAEQVISATVASVVQTKKWREASFFLIDGGGQKAICELANSPVQRIEAADLERVQRCVDFLQKDLASRRSSLNPRHSRRAAFLIVDNIAALISQSGSGPGSITETLINLARDGAGHGIYVLFTARGVRELPSRLSANIKSKLFFAHSNSSDASLFSLDKELVGQLKGMRALTPQNYLVQACESPTEAVVSEVFAMRKTNGIAPELKIGTIRDKVPFEALKASFASSKATNPGSSLGLGENSDSEVELIIGRRADDLSCSTVTANAGQPVILLGRDKEALTELVSLCMKQLEGLKTLVLWGSGLDKLKSLRLDQIKALKPLVAHRPSFENSQIVHLNAAQGFSKIDPEEPMQPSASTNAAIKALSGSKQTAGLASHTASISEQPALETEISKRDSALCQIAELANRHQQNTTESTNTKAAFKAGSTPQLESTIESQLMEQSDVIVVLDADAINPRWAELLEAHSEKPQVLITTPASLRRSRLEMTWLRSQVANSTAVLAGPYTHDLEPLRAQAERGVGDQVQLIDQKRVAMRVEAAEVEAIRLCEPL